MAALSPGYFLIFFNSVLWWGDSPTTEKPMPNHSSILLVEDDPRDVELIRRAFKQARMANPIKVVNDGADARDYLSGAGVYADRTQYPVPFLVLLDLNLPRVSGLDVLEWIRKQAGLEELRVVILTSSRDAPDMERAYALGANSYLNKPGNFEQPVMLMSSLEFHWAVIEQSPPGTPSARQ